MDLEVLLINQRRVAISTVSSSDGPVDKSFLSSLIESGLTESDIHIGFSKLIKGGVDKLFPGIMISEESAAINSLITSHKSMTASNMSNPVSSSTNPSKT